MLHLDRLNGVPGHPLLELPTDKENDFSRGCLQEFIRYSIYLEVSKLVEDFIRLLKYFP